MTPDDLDLARAKDLRMELVTMANCLQEPCLMEPCECAATLARAIREGDAARRLVVVRRSDLISIRDMGLGPDRGSGQWQSDFAVATVRAMLATSPLAGEE